MGKRKPQERGGDQFGDWGGSQDREQHQGFGAGRGGGGAGGGGGTAGKRSVKGDLSFSKHVPKFLQPYAHMLGVKKQQDEEEPIIVGKQPQEEEDSDREDAGEVEAIQRALADNPELAAQVGDTIVKKMEATQEKERGNKAFKDKKYDEAITSFTRCIELDPDDAVFYSNRSAALLAKEEWDKSLEDAERVVALKPNWVKGHARKAAALMGLQCYGEAKECYQRALKYEPDDAALQKGLDKAIALELQHMREHKHVYKRHKASSTGVTLGQAKAPVARAAGGAAAAAAAAGPGGAGSSSRPPPAAAGVKNKAMLSFGDDDEEEEG